MLDMQHTHSKPMLHTVAGLASCSSSSITRYVRRVKHNKHTMLLQPHHLLLLPPLPDPPDPRQLPNLLLTPCLAVQQNSLPGSSCQLCTLLTLWETSSRAQGANPSLYGLHTRGAGCTGSSTG
jgi:hypothetical protein